MKNKLCILFACIQIIVFQAKTQVYSTGIVSLSSTSGFPMTIKIDISTLVTLTLTGPSDRWFAVGFNANNMANGTDVVAVHSNGTLSSFDAKLTGYAAPVPDPTQNWTISSDQISSGIRTVVATRALNTSDPNDYIFNASSGALSLIWARASSIGFSYAYHGSSNRGMSTATFSLIPPPAAPSGSANQAFCGGATLSQLIANGSNIKWYSVATGGSVLSNSIVLINGSTYYASQTVNGQESVNRLAVTTTVTPNSINTTQVTASGSYTWAENGQTYTSSGIYAGSTANCVTQSLNLTITTNATLALNVFIDGYYTNNSSPAAMVPARYTNLDAFGSSNPGTATDVDMVTVQLRSPSNLEVVAYSVNAILQTNGSLQCVFPAGATNGSYYIVLLHRAANPLWSANPVTITASSSYSFSNSASSAYGVSQLHQLSTNLYGLWLGEMNDDGYIDGSDFSEWQIDAILSESGQYLLDGDFNGDSYVDPSDYPAFDFNAQQGVEAQRP